MSAWAERWFEFYLLALAQGTVFLALLLLSLRAMRRAPAALLYAVGMLGILKLLLPPILPAPLRFGPASMLQAVREVWILPETFLPEAVSPGVLGPNPGVVATGTKGDVTLWLAGIWLAGVVLGLAIPLFATFRLASRLRGARRVPLDEPLRGELGPRFEVWRSERIALPLTLFLLPRRIFVPAAWDEWKPAQRRLFVRHELAHLHRHDGWTQLAQTVARALFWVHPLVHVLARRLDEWREMACDDASLGPGREEAFDYARYIVHAAQCALLGSESRAAATALLGRRAPLRRRIAYQLRPVADPKGATMFRRRTLVSVMIPLVVLALLLSVSWNAGHDSRALAQPASPPPEGVTVTLAPDGRMDVEGESISVRDFGKAMLLLHRTDREPSDLVLRLRCDEGLAMGDLHAYQNTFADAGYRKLLYLRPNGQRLPFALPGPGLRERLAGVEKEHQMRLVLDARGRCSERERVVTLDELGERVRARLQSDPQLVVVLETDPAALVGAYYDVFEAVQTAGAERVAVIPPPPPKN